LIALPALQASLATGSGLFFYTYLVFRFFTFSVYEIAELLDTETDGIQRRAPSLPVMGSEYIYSGNILRQSGVQREFLLHEIGQYDGGRPAVGNCPEGVRKLGVSSTRLGRFLAAG
jgi:hypothetical protein